MTFVRLLFRNLFYHWRGNLAVLLGVAVGTAVLTGALLVGDALRGSLRDLALQRFGWVDQVMIAGRFVKEDLGNDLPAERVAPVILLRATALDADGKAVRRVMLLGVDDRFGQNVPSTNFWKGTTAGVVLSPALAKELKAKQGDTVRLQVLKPTAAPRESPLGQRDDEGVGKLEVTVEAILGEGNWAAQFSLQPSPEAPRNAYVPLKYLQRQFKQPGRVNALLAGGVGDGLADAFRRKLDLDAFGLRLHTPATRAADLLAAYKRRVQAKLPIAEAVLRQVPGALAGEPTYTDALRYYQDNQPFLTLESRELLLDAPMEKRALEAAAAAKLRTAPTLVYIAKLTAGKKTILGVVAALDPSAKAPLGPFKPEDVAALRPGEIVLADWSKQVKETAKWRGLSLLPLKEGEEVVLTFKPPEQKQDKFPDDTKPFRYAGSIPMTGAALDPHLTPEFPGITDKSSTADWKLPFADEDDKDWGRAIIEKEYGDPYWYEFRTTPKAYVRLDDVQDIWGSRFGNLTAIRMAPRSGNDLKTAEKDFTDSLLGQLRDSPQVLKFQSLKADALNNSTGGTDFGGLFLGFSFFLIAAALLLVGLLFRLNLNRRASEIGLLRASGFAPGTVYRLYLAEGSLVALAGTLLGVGFALGYAALLVQFLAAIWPRGVLRSFLRPHYSTMSLGLGALGSLLVSVLTIAFSLRGLGRVPPRALLAGQTEMALPGLSSKTKWSWWILGIAVVGAVVLFACGPWMTGHMAKAGMFFGSGALLLTAALAAVSAWMRSGRQRTVEGHGAWAVARLGVRNAARYPTRSLLTAGLLASAAFLLVAVEAFRRHADFDASDPKSPSGGFNLLGEMDRPPRFSNPTGEQALDVAGGVLDRLAPMWATLGSQEERDAKRKEAATLLRQLEIIPIRVKSGDDASCLNLYQPTRPLLLGVPDALIERGGFTVVERADTEDANPWEALRRKPDPKEKAPPIPVFGEQNTVGWQLHLGLRGTLKVPSEDAKQAKRTLRIDGLLQDSIFQSGLLMYEKRFLELYPSHDGPTMFLIRAPKGKEAEVKALLETAYAPEGLEVTETEKRLEDYLAVENTYLTTFQALGGLGLLLGSLGLAVVLLRGVWERRAELALLRALGWRRRTLAWLVLAENAWLLLLGLAAGTIAAAIAVAPHMTAGGSVPWGHLLGLFGVVLVVALTSAVLAVVSTLRAPLLPALRRE